MSAPQDCDRFQDILDRGPQEEWTAKDHRWVDEHAQACQLCAQVLKMRRLYPDPPTNEGEDNVPADRLAEIWPRVEQALPAPPDVSGRQRSRSWFAGILRPALAGLAVVLVLTNTMMFAQMQKVLHREEGLRAALDQQETRLLSMQTELDARGAEASFAASEAGSEATARWSSFLGSRADLTVGELRQVLGRLPAQTVILSPRSAQTLRLDLGSGFNPRPVLAAAALSWEDGLQAGELLAVIDVLKLEDQLELSAIQSFVTSRQLPSRTAL